MKLRLNIADKTVFYYPDLLLSCAPDDRQPYFRSRPCLIVEVLSDSTERIDRREKLLAYQTLPSLQEYVLVAQNARRVEVYRRTNDWKAEYSMRERFGLIAWRAVYPSMPSMPTSNRLKHRRRTRLPHPESTVEADGRQDLHSRYGTSPERHRRDRLI